MIDEGHLIQQINVYVPPTNGMGYPYQSPPFIGTWGNPIGMGVKKKKLQVQRKRTSSRKKQPIQLNSHSRHHFVIKPLSNFDLMEWIKKLGIKHFRGIYSRDGLPHKIKKECGIINLDDIQGPGTHWVCYRNGGSASPQNPLLVGKVVFMSISILLV